MSNVISGDLLGLCCDCVPDKCGTRAFMKQDTGEVALCRGGNY